MGAQNNNDSENRGSDDGVLILIFFFFFWFKLPLYVIIHYNGTTKQLLSRWVQMLSLSHTGF
jgi:hypothetical protein